MSTIVHISDLFQRYKVLIKGNPLLASEIENALRWISYLISGRFKDSNIFSEFVYTLSTILQLINDILLREVYNIKLNLNEAVEKLKIFVTVVEYTQVFFEITSKKFGGEAGRWFMITVIQTTKAVIRLILLFRYGEGIQRQVPFMPLDRIRDLHKGNQQQNPDFFKEGLKEICESNGMTTTLKRSGRVIRTLDHAPPRSKRTWTLNNEASFLGKLIKKESKDAPPTELNDLQKVGEVLHIIRPLIHLSATFKYGFKAWTPYLLSLGIDITSLHLIRGSNVSMLNFRERIEIGQRTVALFLYLMRSPFYDSYTKMKILNLLKTFSEKIPLFGPLMKPFISYLPEWQKTYFYNWNT